jgi:hypothetical protein
MKAGVLLVLYNSVLTLHPVAGSTGGLIICYTMSQSLWGILFDARHRSDLSTVVFDFGRDF